MMSKRQRTIIMLMLFFSTLLNVLCFFFITMKNTLDIQDKYEGDYMGLYWYNKHPRFDYLNGLYLGFMGIMLFCIWAIVFDSEKRKKGDINAV